MVVGAGFAGLGAARELLEAGLSVQVLEARPRVGGRTLTRYLPDGTQLDLGGQWIGPTQHRIRELVDHFGISTYPTPAHGDPVVDIGGERLASPPREVDSLLEEIDLLALQITPERPWDAPEARAWDQQTFASWLAGTEYSETVIRYVARVVSGGLLAGAPAEASLLETLFYVASAGGIQPLMGYEGGAQETRIVGGAQSIAEHMADELPPGVLRLAEPVTAVEYDSAGARLTTTTHTYTASRVIVAVPPTLAARIRYDPPLPALSDGALQRTPAGGALKVHAVYPAPFWRDRGLSGMSTSDSGVLTETVDNTPPNSPRAVLTGFVYGDEAVLLRGRSLEERRRIVLERLGELFGDQALSPDDYVEFDWMAEEWTRGCFSGHLVPGSTVTFGPALRTPVEVVHWASTETATEWNGYFDGAVASGRRAAEEVRAALGR
ncbi:FAD-dependent oxidoreductase [Nocardiopsis exhalans]|uniref:FAD-dependent oxidoreductase n=1 Tax=Nocardiopsis exhalans TaxID=163604 RepID=A0ABY5DGX3_9ACTN|nr:FAD-dependent oxidoreductase [Nocardiopsis exhalans]USY22600.1 FAD-dependent oxidoreductase [Nocardiopsis exhalans]